MNPSKFDPQTTALVFIDLQNGISGRTLAPHSASDVVARAAYLAAALRMKGVTVVYVRIDVVGMPHLPADAPTRDPNAPPPPTTTSQLIPENGIRAATC